MQMQQMQANCTCLTQAFLANNEDVLPHVVPWGLGCWEEAASFRATHWIDVSLCGRISFVPGSSHLWLWAPAPSFHCFLRAIIFIYWNLRFSFGYLFRIQQWGSALRQGTSVLPLWVLVERGGNLVIHLHRHYLTLCVCVHAFGWVFCVSAWLYSGHNPPLAKGFPMKSLLSL